MACIVLSKAKNYFLGEVESRGWCLDLNGNDQNSGVESIGSALSKLDCWSQCKAIPRAKGCEYIKQHKRCDIHTNHVSRGGGDRLIDYDCLVLY